MATTLVATGGKGSNPKTSLYVGGLAENVNEEILQAAFLPFGNLKDINIPLDHATGKHRGGWTTAGSCHTPCTCGVWR